MFIAKRAYIAVWRERGLFKKAQRYRARRDKIESPLRWESCVGSTVVVEKCFESAVGVSVVFLAVEIVSSVGSNSAQRDIGFVSSRGGPE